MGRVSAMRIFLLMSLIAFFLSPATWASLPKGKTIAVLVKGDPSYAAISRSVLVRILLDDGYKAVDEAQLERIRKSKASALALDGNTEAILQLGKTFGFNVLLSAQVTAPQAVKNEFELFTATATVSATASTASNAMQIAAATASAKEVGYTAAEASQKAVSSAARSAALVLLDKKAEPSAAKFLLIAPARSFSEAHAIAESCREAGAESASVIRFAGGKAEVEAMYSGPVRKLILELLKRRKDLREEKIEEDTVYLLK